MAWQTPKTDWAADDGITSDDLNRIEGNVADFRFSGGANGRLGVATFDNAASVTVNNTSVTANTLILITCNSLTFYAGTPIFYISAKTPGVSFVINVSGGSSIYGTVAYLLLEPQ